MKPEALRSFPTADTLFARFRATGDPGLLGEVFDEAAPGLFRLALTLTPDAASAEDAVQETFLFAMEEADRWDPSRPVVPWLTGILRLKVKESRRFAKRTPGPEQVSPLAAPGDPADLAVTAEERERIHEAMQALPEPYRGVALLRWRYGLEPSEIADVRGVPPGTVWSILSRALKRLRVELGALAGMLLLSFRESRGLDGVREALLRRATADLVAAGAAGGAVVATGGLLVMKAGMGVAAVVAAGAIGFLLLGNGEEGGPPAESAIVGTPPAVEEPPPAPPPVPPKDPPEESRPPVRPSTAPPIYDRSLATATLRVRTRFEGEPPRMRPIRFDADPKCGEAQKGEVLNPTVVVRDGLLANAVVHVAEGAERWTFPTPTATILLEQRGCMFVPHVFTAMVDQAILIRNSDPVMHNVHGMGRRNVEFNRSQIAGAKDLVERFRKPELGVKIKCDVHGWMSSFVGVFDHPFHGVSDADGWTELRVPAGTFTVAAWHEKLAAPAGREVTVKDGETVEIEFVFGGK